MKPYDYVGVFFCIGFGLCYIVMPHKVIRFYEWFHSGKVKMPQPFGVRLAGVIWILLVLAVSWFVFHR